MSSGMKARWIRGALTPVVAVLSMALAASAGLGAPVAHAAGGGLGKPSLPKQRVDKVRAHPGLGAKRAREQVARGRTVNAAQAKRARAQQHAVWPADATATGRIPGQGATRLMAGGLAVTVAAGRANGSASGQVQVRILGQRQAQAAGIKGVILTASASAPGSARLSVDYSAFASAYGGGWSGRLRLVQLPACVLTTPQKAACRTQTPLGSHNDIGKQTLTAKVGLGQAGRGAGPERASRSMPRAALMAADTTSSATVLAATATSGESASGAGNYAASPLSASTSWAAGGSSGAFSWSYPMTTPPAAAGPAPQLSLSYDSGSVDGRTASTNNQGSQVGEGYDLTSSYVERSYGSCDDDGQDGKYDLCWKYDNALLVLNGKSTELVKDDTTGAWHLKDDDASTVTHSTGADNGDEGDSGLDGAGEYWTVTTGDGTKYVFGLDKLPGADTQRTNSVWTVPVFGDDSGEPGYSAGDSFSGRALNQAWRWNLDYVVDPHGNAMSYWYTAETNYYGKNGASTGTAQYTRGGYLTKILYGQNKDTLFTGTASDEVTFGYDERCTASDCSSLTSSTASNWPDVPFDRICASGADCLATGPTFFTRKRLTSIDTHAWSASTSAYTDVDSWALAQQFLDPGDIGNSSDQTLVLKSIRHTGKNGTAVSLDPVTFTYQMRPNRVDSSTDNILPLNRPRIQTITSETGAVTTVTLSNPECVRGSTMPSSEDNDTMSCYPVYWHINGATEASLDWFNKYRVTDVITSDPTGHGETMESHYSYSGPAWHYSDNPITPDKERTWSDWRGYRTVTTVKGASSETQSKTVSLYLQGMDGDRQKDGTTRSVSVPGIGFTGLSVADQTDSDRFAGFSREQVTYNGSAPVSVTVDYPWSQLTASQKKSYADIQAYFVRTYKTETSTYLTATAGWRTHSVNTSFDSYGMPVSVNDSGQLGLSGDETCTRTWYARNASLGITSLVSRTRVVGRACSTAETDLNLPASSGSRGDVLSDKATVYDGTSATAWTASQTPTLGNATWTGRASAYPATATNGERYPTSWQTVASTTGYDTLGRPGTVTDAAGNPTTTVYTPTTTGPLTKVTVTNAKTQKSYSYLDYARGTPVKVYDVNTKLTESTYDALGRVTAVWLPNRSRAAGYGANYTYAYSVTGTAPSWVSTSTIRADGVYNTSYTIYDSLLRSLQTQSPTANGGRLLTDTRYDSRGLAYETYADVFDSATSPSGTYARAEYGGAPKQTDTEFDGAERPTSSTFYVYGVKKRSTSTTYTGDSTATTAPAGGSAVRTIADIFGRTTERRDYSGNDPADTAYGAGSGAAYTSTKYAYTRDGKPDTVTGPDGTKWSYTYDLFGRQVSATDPDKGTTTTSYTDLDQVSGTTDSRNTTLLYGYDELGRTTDEWQTARTDADKLTHWAYDTLAKGQLDSATSYVGGVTGTAYTRKVTAYDSLYRPTTTQLVLPSTDPLVTSGAVAATTTSSTYYNLDGTRQYISEPAAGGLAAETVNTGYDTVGLPTTVSGSSGYLLGAAYSAIGQTDQLTLGTSAAAGTKKAYITNAWEEGTDRLKQSAVTDQTHNYELQELNYAYDDAGNVTSITDPTTLGGTGKADDQCFTYDGHRRLTEAWTPTTADCSTSGRTAANLGGAAPYWTSYSYSDSGLRDTETSHTSAGDTTKTYCYGDTAHPHGLTATTTASSCTGVTATYAYDKTGNTTGRPNGTDSQSLTWNPEGRLDTLTEKSSSGTTKSTTSHIYDADGNLLIRRNTGGETVLYLDDATEVHLDASTSTTKYWAQRYYTAGATTIALRSNQTGTETLSWLAADRHGTSSLALDATSQAITTRYTTPFGAPRGGGTGTWPDDKTFLGKATDSTSSLTYVGAREYAPATGRFLSVDLLLDTSDAQSLNGYTYADDNPTTGSDPTGLRDCGETEYCGKGSRPNLEYGTAASADAKDILPDGRHVDAAVVGATAAAIRAAAAQTTYEQDAYIAKISGKNSVSGAVAVADQEWQTKEYLAAAREVRADVLASLQKLVAEGKLSPTQFRRFTTISVAWDEKKKTIYWAALKSQRKGSRGYCAEDLCDSEAESHGSKKEDLQFTETLRPRDEEEVEICIRCQDSHELDQFKASGAKMQEGGRLAELQNSEAVSEAEAEEYAELEAESMAQAEAMAFEDE
ncbi:RHS repeat-associated core domain-containing protein [Streptomyces sp. DG2A-72]|uniref:RHS repeat-associated core domain-containing protein n=1 Tax=Streptomyces sp. DG2A-72 TaxID=3051386 RepID=UPI00265BE9FD|nr:RHS repeat-associated core domain-containing protein [Streptomyces sp. DG2A-72]MDO0935251.1 RHS repeat-associated core domain-containing protein [Streptomyces sp. DG2A-72]